MLKRIISFIKAPWLCEIVSKVATGVASALTVINFIKEQVDGSEVGEKVVETLTDVAEFLTAALDILNKASEFLCGNEVQANSVEDIDEAIINLKATSASLKNL